MKAIKLLENNPTVNTIALLTIISLLMWTIGIQNVQADGITNYSNTLSDSDPTAISSHTLAYTTSTAATAAQTIDFGYSDDWDFSVLAGGVDATDFTVNSGTMTIVDSCTAAANEVTPSASDTGGSKGFTLTVCASDTIPAGSFSITVGDGAAGGADDIINPSTEGSQEITLGGTQVDSGATRVFIINNIDMTATVPTSFTFTILGTGSGLAGANSEPTTTTVSTNATTIPWGTIQAGTEYAAAHTLSVGTNASNGFSVTLEQDANLTNASSDDIDLFIDGAATAAPASWAAPTGTLGTEDTYGHYGITSEDSDLNGDEFAAALYAGNIASPREVFSHTGVSDGQTNGTGTADIGATVVGYKIEISALQEAGDYSNVLTYIATPTF